MTRLLELEQGRFAHASGALWLPAASAVLIADAHLGYGWAMRRRGQLGPVIDGSSLPKLELVLDELSPAHIIFLGDLVHAPKPGVEERAFIESTLTRIAARAQITVVRGNHDRAFARDFGHLNFPFVPEWRGAGIVAVHGDRLDIVPETHLVLGHLHPSINIYDGAGASQRLPLFLTSQRATVLPAFSPFAAGFNIRTGLPAPLRTLYARQKVEGIAVSGKRVASIGVVHPRRTVE